MAGVTMETEFRAGATGLPAVAAVRQGRKALFS
jgi:hypothetical protein